MCFIASISFLIVCCNFQATTCLYTNFFKHKPDQDYEIVYFPKIPISQSKNDQTVDEVLDFTVFGRSVSLKLKLNDNLISPTFKSYVNNDEGNIVLMHDAPRNCHYLHKDSQWVAALSICEPKSVQGFLFMENSTFEIHPLTHHLSSVLNLKDEALTANIDGYPHLIQKAAFSTSKFHHFLYSDKRKFNSKHDTSRKYTANNEQTLTAELALFFDAEAYNIFSPYFNYDDNKIVEMLLVYINSVQALYHHSSIGTKLDLVLVRLDIMKTQPPEMPHYKGEQTKLLDSFCSYQSILNKENDEDPDHWDMALYISGLDFFAIENGQNSYVAMGLAAVGGVCYSQYACVIAELGTATLFGKPYPSAGFTSVYVLAHEIGHNLGMQHDGNKNNCPKEGFIMSASRGDFGEAQWSPCSADVMKRLKNTSCLKDFTGTPDQELDHSRFKDIPGKFYVAKKQCELLLKDKDAVVSLNQKLSDVCYSLECKTPHGSGTYFSGPALEGTECGKDMYCTGGECVSNSALRISNKLGTKVFSDIDYIQMHNNAVDSNYEDY